MSTNSDDERKPTAVSPADEKKKHKFVLQESDDEDNEDTSPTEVSGPNGYYIRICPEGDGGISGFLFYMDGFGDKRLADLFYTTVKSKNITNFKKFIGCANRVINPIDDDGDHIMNINGHKYRAIAVVTGTSKEAPTEESIKEWHNDIFLPAFKQMVELRDNQWPVVNENMLVKESWLEVLGKDDFNYVYKRFTEWQLENSKGPAKPFAKWIKMKSANLYSVYKPGTLKKLTIKTLGLSKDMLSEEDQKNFPTLTKK